MTRGHGKLGRDEPCILAPMQVPTVLPELEQMRDEVAGWRRDFHAHPETAFEEVRTAERIAALLASFGFEVHRGLARTGVVGTLRVGASARAIALRADMDALAMDEETDAPWRSESPGRMHACGHDGHMAMLLAAARALATRKRFGGVVHLVFQPAEENEGGGKVMVEEGLFDRFPVEAVFGMHAIPGLATGHFAVHSGPVMASADYFWIRVVGRGTHAAYPHRGADPLPAAAASVVGLQTIASRAVDPLEAAVVSVTQIHGGTTLNVLPEAVELSGTVRALQPGVRDLLERRIIEVANGIAAAHGVRAEIRTERRYPPTINHAAPVEQAVRAATAVVGADRVRRDLPPSMGAEDFAFMLQARPGAYVWLGAGEERAMVHSPRYDFPDEISPIGASYWVTLVEQILA